MGANTSSCSKPFGLNFRHRQPRVSQPPRHLVPDSPWPLGRLIRARGLTRSRAREQPYALRLAQLLWPDDSADDADNAGTPLLPNSQPPPSVFTRLLLARRADPAARREREARVPSSWAARLRSSSGSAPTSPPLRACARGRLGPPSSFVPRESREQIGEGCNTSAAWAPVWISERRLPVGVWSPGLFDLCIDGEAAKFRRAERRF